MLVTFHEPLLVVALDERPDLALGVGEIGEAVPPQALLFQRPHEALEHAVALGLTDERWRVLNTEPAQLRPESMGRVLRAPVGPHGQAARHILPKAAEGRTARPGRAARALPTDPRASSPSTPRGSSAA